LKKLECINKKRAEENESPSALFLQDLLRSGRIISARKEGLKQAMEREAKLSTRG
jgi:hypothetical protein